LKRSAVTLDEENEGEEGEEVREEAPQKRRRDRNADQKSSA
jgi:hypothetical protein